MELISYRSCYMLGVDDKALDSFIDEIKSFLHAVNVPEDYRVNVYKDEVTCCGHYPIGVAIEIEGPKGQQIKAIDEKVLEKVHEICGREHIVQHECSPAELLQNINGKIFAQG